MTGRDARRVGRGGVVEAVESRVLYAVNLVALPTGGSVPTADGIRVSVTNHGTEAVGPVAVRLTAVDGDGVAVREPIVVAVGPIGAESSATGEFAFVLPSRATSYVARVFAEVDPENAVVETEEGDNVSTGFSVTVPAEMGDFGNPYTVFAGSAGGVFNVATSFVYTPGRGAAAPFTLRYVLSADGVLGNADDVTVGSLRLTDVRTSTDVTPGRNLPYGPRGGPLNVNTSGLLVFPVGLAAGDYTLFTTLDARGEVAETNEGNNTSSTAITISAPASAGNGDPSAVISYPTAGVTTPIQDGFEPTVTLKNDGTAVINGGFDGLLVALDSNGDVIAYGEALPGPFGPGDSFTTPPAPPFSSHRIVLPEGYSYTARIAVIADPVDKLWEGDELDNVAIGPAFQVNAGSGLPELAGPAAGGAGSPTITNRPAPPDEPPVVTTDLGVAVRKFKTAGATPGSKAEVKIAVTNNSAVRANGRVPVTVYLSRFSVRADNDPVLVTTTVRVNNLRPGRTQTFVLKGRVPETVAAATSYRATAEVGTIASLPGADDQTAAAMSANAIGLAPRVRDLAVLSTQTDATRSRVTVQNLGNVEIRGPVTFVLRGRPANSSVESTEILRTTRMVSLGVGKKAKVDLKLPREFPFHGAYSLDATVTLAGDGNGNNDGVFGEVTAHP